MIVNHIQKSMQRTGNDGGGHGKRIEECHEPDLHARQTSGAQSVEARAPSASPCSSTLLYLLQVPLKSSRIPSLFMQTICRTFVSHLEALLNVLQISNLNLSSLSLQPEVQRALGHSRSPSPNTPGAFNGPTCCAEPHAIEMCAGI